MSFGGWRRLVGISALLVWIIPDDCMALVGRTTPEGKKHNLLGENQENLSRREAFGVGVASVFGCVTASAFVDPAVAFDNKVSTKYDDRPKQRGGKVRLLLWLIFNFNSTIFR
jgi:hypothetical protein